MQRYGPLRHCKPSDHCVGSCWAIVELGSCRPISFALVDLANWKGGKWNDGKVLDQSGWKGDFYGASLVKLAWKNEFTADDFECQEFWKWEHICATRRTGAWGASTSGMDKLLIGLFLSERDGHINSIKVWGSFHSCTATSANEKFEVTMR